MQDVERLAGMIITFGIVFLAVALRDWTPWTMVLPGLVIIAGSILMWRVKVAQREINRFNGNGECKNPILYSRKEN